MDMVLTMNASVPRTVLQHLSALQDELPIEADTNRRYVWESSFGPILIEIVGNNILVNGSPVEQAALFFNDGAEFLDPS